MKILIIEDEAALAIAVNRLLSQAGYDVTWQADGKEGLKAALEGEFDLIILDLLLPRLNGWEICRELRSDDINIPILMLSALDEASDKVRGLDVGADDFLGKPFDTDELLARVRALLRKNMVHRGERIQIADLEIDRESRKVIRDGVELDLARSEYEILLKLAAHEGLQFKPDELAKHIPIEAAPLGDPFENCMASLRAKVDGPFSRPLIRVTEGAYLLCTAAD